MGSSSTRIAYQAFSSNGTADYSVVIDREGIIRYRGDGVDVSEIQMFIDNLLATSIGEAGITPDQFRLNQNYPNPFNPGTRIQFYLPARQSVRLTIFDSQGRRIRTLIHSTMNAGDHELGWDGLTDDGVRVASGTYFYQLVTPDFRQTRKMILIR